MHFRHRRFIYHEHTSTHWPLQDSVRLQCFFVGLQCFFVVVNHPFTPPPAAKPTLLQYYCTPDAQYTTPIPTPRLYAIHHTLSVMAISCKGQSTHGLRVNPDLVVRFVTLWFWMFFVSVCDLVFVVCVCVCDLFLFKHSVYITSTRAHMG